MVFLASASSHSVSAPWRASAAKGVCLVHRSASIYPGLLLGSVQRYGNNSLDSNKTRSFRHATTADDTPRVENQPLYPPLPTEISPP